MRRILIEVPDNFPDDLDEIVREIENLRKLVDLYDVQRRELMERALRAESLLRMLQKKLSEAAKEVDRKGEPGIV